MRNKTCRSLFLSLLIAGLTVTPCYAATTQSKISDAQSKKQQTQDDLKKRRAEFLLWKQKKMIYKLI